MVSQALRREFDTAHGRYEVRYRLGRDGLTVDGLEELSLVEVAPNESSSSRRAADAFDVARYGDLVYVDSALGPVALRPVPRFLDPAEQAAAGSLLAPMPGTVVRLAVAARRPGATPASRCSGWRR